MMKKASIAVIVMALALALAPASAFAANAGLAAGEVAAGQANVKVAGTANLDAAKAMFGVTNVIEASPADIATAKDLNNLMSNVPTAPAIVHVASGAYTYDKYITVPENVILCVEDGVTFTLSKCVKVSGSVYGGTYIVAGRDNRTIEFANKAFSGVNGTVAYTVSSNDKSTSKNYGIVVNGSSTTGAKILNNTVSDCYSGINVFRGATAEEISGNTTTGNLEAGINIVKSDVHKIKNNTISNNGKHGISTDIASAMDGKSSCTIDEISGNTIANNGKKGLYVESSLVKKVANNVITGNETGIGVGAGSKALALNGNKVCKNKNENLVCTGSGAYVEIVANNKFDGATNKSKGNGVVITDKAKVKVTGAKNTFSSNKKNGISLTKKATLQITTKSGKNQVQKNKNMGIGVYGKSKANIKNVNFNKNKKYAMYVEKGSKGTYKKCNLKTSGKNRIVKA